MQNFQYLRVVARDSLACSSGAVVGVYGKRAKEIVGNRPERIGPCPGEKGGPADLVALDGIGERECGLVVQRGELSAELAIKAKQRPSFDCGKRVGEIVVTIGIDAGAEVAFHRVEVQFAAAGLKISLLALS